MKLFIVLILILFFKYMFNNIKHLVLFKLLIWKHFRSKLLNSYINAWHLCFKARSNGWNMLVKHCWTQHVRPVWIARSNMLDSVAWCWTMLDEVWFCSNFSSNIVERSKYAIISCLVLKFQHCWMVLNSLEHSSIQHNPTLIKHRPTPRNNVG